MANNLTNSPLCTNERARQALEMGQHYDRLYGAKSYPYWEQQLASLRQNGLSPSPYVGYVDIAHMTKVIFESLDTALIGNGAGLVSRATSRMDGLDQTWQETVSGENVEFNAMIQRLVQQQIRQHEETKEARLQVAIDNMAAANLQVSALAPDDPRKTEIFGQAMENLKQTIPTQDTAQLATVDLLLQEISNLALGALNKKP